MPVQPARLAGARCAAGWRAGIRRAGIFLLAAGLAACAGPSRTPVPASGPLSLQGSCSQVDDDGFREQARLDVEQGAVRALDWQIWVGRKGTCSFRLDQFRQTKSRPHIELQALDRSGCKLVIYQDPRRVTLGHAGCERSCTNGIHEEAWPVMFDPRSGGCANLNR
jgi:hypothetical protein